MSLIQRTRKYRILHTPRFFSRFRKNTDAAYCRGNQVVLFRNGAEFFPAMLEAVATAASHVHLEFYIIRNDTVGRKFADTLLAASSRGVAVSLMYDYIGCFDTPAAYFRRLEAGGVKCCAFNPPPFRKGLSWFDKRDHRKMVLVDGSSAFLGGVNIADEYAGYGDSLTNWRDIGVRIDGPTVTALETLFRTTWLQEEGTPLNCGQELLSAAREMGNAEVHIVSGGPHHNRSTIRNAFRMAIAGAAECVRIINPYFVPGPRLIRSLLRAASRGIRVQLILPARSDVPLVRLVSRSCYSALLKGGVEIYEREGTILHAKVMLIDDYWVVLGSANLDQRSFHRNYEVNVIVDSRDFGVQVLEMFDEDLALSKRINLDAHERRGLVVRGLERFFSIFGWFL